jgi:hypothetical protein
VTFNTTYRMTSGTSAVTATGASGGNSGNRRNVILKPSPSKPKSYPPKPAQEPCTPQRQRQGFTSLELEATPESFTTETASSGLSFAFGEFGTDPETGVTTPNGSSGKRDNDGTGDLRSSKRQKKPQTKAKEQEDDVAIT